MTEASPEQSAEPTVSGYKAGELTADQLAERARQDPDFLRKMIDDLTAAIDNATAGKYVEDGPAEAGKGQFG